MKVFAVRGNAIWVIHYGEMRTTPKCNVKIYFGKSNEDENDKIRIML